jgi:hypothetical protein
MRVIPFIMLTAALAGCQAAELADPAVSAGKAADAVEPNRITVYGQNIYVGTDVDAVIAALASPDPTDDVPTLLAEIEVLQNTDFTARAAGIAAEIDRTRPDAVGFNEISKIDVDLTPLGLPLVAHEDFLPEMLSALAARNLHYVVAGQVQNIVAAPLPGVQLIDWDVVLVNTDRVTVGAGVVEKNFSNNLGPVAPGVTLIRGWVSVPVTIDGRDYTVVATHPESNLSGVPGIDLLRAAQVGELVASLPTGTPTLLLGDFNDRPGSPMYQVITDAGFTDTWAAMRPGVDGFTCCNEADLMGSSRPDYNKRYDYVFARDIDGVPGRVQGRIDRYGVTPADQIAGPSYSLWPSDHAGLVASFIQPPALFR